jgi:2-polyprenyl-3-methyl-5-hydroxy-6-metoxy-1,4-benzoquinol methylase
MRELTSIDYWDQGYKSRSSQGQLSFDWRNHVNTQILQKIDGIGLHGKSVLEIGAGDSEWLPHLAQKYVDSQFCGLDFSEAGCARLADKVSALAGQAKVGVYNQDMFVSESALHGKFDVVLSFGVVEHFTDLPTVLQAKRRYLKPGGRMFSLIPNMAGSIGYLSRVFNREVFDMHVPHDVNSFVEGHRRAGLIVESSGYLGSSNYGVLSSCFKRPGGIGWHSYVFLTRVSKAVLFAESRLGKLPVSRLLSPYIYVISRAN